MTINANSRQNRKPKLFIYSHTHWDREWYLSQNQFQYRLIRTLDEIIDILAADNGFDTFVLDGQTSIVEDYLELRPDRSPALRQLIAAGRLVIGPWFTMPDIFLPDGEALIRNLLRGSQDCRALGAPFPNTGYVPDSFGHIEQMPQLMRGVGIDNYIFSRGRPVAISLEQGWRREFIWEAPDGSRVYALPLSTSYAAAMPVDAVSMRAPTTVTNGLLQVLVNDNGTLDLLDLQTGVCVKNTHYFAQDGDRGGGYHFEPIPRDRRRDTRATAATITVLQNGPLRTRIEVKTMLRVPARYDRRSGRRTGRCTVPVCTVLTLEACSRLLRFHTRIDNTARHQRIRLILPSPLATQTVHADASFAVHENDASRWPAYHCLRVQGIRGRERPDSKILELWRRDPDRFGGRLFLSGNLDSLQPSRTENADSPTDDRGDGHCHQTV